MTEASSKRRSLSERMNASVGKGIDLTLAVAGHDDRRLADRRGDVVARIGDLACQTQEAPGRTLEDPFLLELGYCSGSV